MAFNTAEGRAVYTASSAQTEFTFTFKVFTTADIKVYQTTSGDTPNDTTDLLTITTDYTVTINGDNGGTITLNTGAGTGDTITLVRDLDVKRDVDYQDNGDLLASTLDSDQNYQTYLIQQAQTANERTIRLQDTTDADATLPAPNAGYIFRWNLTSDGIEAINPADVLDTTNTITVETIADLSTIDTASFKTAIVKDLDRGGTFIWSSTGTANDGTVFAGATGFWNRQYSGAVNVKWFGTDYDSFFAMNGDLILSGNHTITLSNPINFLDCLDRLDVETGSIVSITIVGGEFTIPTKTVIRGNLEGLTVNGSAITTYTFSSLSVVSNGAGDHDVTITLSTTPTITAGQYVVVKSLVGTGSYQTLGGVWKVTNVSGNDVTVKNTCRKDTIGTFSITSGAVVLIPTVLKYNGIVGLECYSDGGIWKSLVIAGDGTGANTRGVQVSNGGKIELGVSTATPVGIHGFSEHGLYVTNGSVCLCFDSYSCANGQVGLYSLESSDVVATRLVANGNGTSGIVASYNCSIAASQSKTCGNSSRGCYSSNGASIAFVSGFSCDNGETGIRAFTNSIIDATDVTLGEQTTHLRSESYAVIVSTGAVFNTDNGVYNRYTPNNGKIDDNSKAVLKTGVASGSSLPVAAGNLVIDSDTTAGLSILTPEASYGYIYLGNPTNTAEAGLSYRGTSNELAFISNGAKKLAINSTDNIVPAGDNTQDLGSASLRMRVIYAGTGTINTSDILEKTFYEISEAEKLCAIELKGMMRKFRFNDAIDSKGETNARIHFGVGAQYVRDVFSKYELDPFEYALICYDSWEDEFDDEGNVIVKAGDRYGIRYEELLCFIISSM